MHGEGAPAVGGGRELGGVPAVGGGRARGGAPEHGEKRARRAAALRWAGGGAAWARVKFQ